MAESTCYTLLLFYYAMRPRYAAALRKEIGSMTNVLLAAHPTVGHTQALRAIGRHLVADGHSVALATVSSPLPGASLWPAPVQVSIGLAQQLAQDGIQLAPLDFSPRMLWYALQLQRRYGMGELSTLMQLYTAGIERHAMNIAIHAVHLSVDIVVGDYLMPAAMIGSQIAHVPYVALYHAALPFPQSDESPLSYMLAGLPRESAAWRRQAQRLQEMSDHFDRTVRSASRNVGMRMEGGGLLLHPISDTLNIYTTAPEIEPGMAEMRGPVQMVGPCFPDPAQADYAHPALNLPQLGLPKVYAALGSLAQHAPQAAAQIMQALAQLEVQAVVSAGGSSAALQRWQSDRVAIFPHVPQAALMQQVDAVICTGGNSTVQETLAAGRPMMVIPSSGAQVVNGQRVEQLGVGVACELPGLSVERVGQAMRSVLSAEQAAQARALRARLARYGGPRAAADAIVAASQPWANAVGSFAP
ncbi:glycosyltransferase family 1 protein [Chloroflexia bacterium SDU3-3]|nr:glycosyltransferase family 1 protein [Chloroflexia bacterium SDU3-3]